MIHATRPLQTHDLSGKGINFGSHTYFLDHTRTWRASRMGNQLNAGAISETTRTLKTIHTIHSHIHSNKAAMRRMIMMAKWYSVNHVGLKLPDICLRSEVKPRKKPHPGNLPDLASDPGPLRDRHACYRLLHSVWLKVKNILFKSLFVLRGSGHRFLPMLK